MATFSFLTEKEVKYEGFNKMLKTRVSESGRPDSKF